MAAGTKRLTNLLFGIAVLLPLLLTSACGGANGAGSGNVIREFTGSGTQHPDSFTVPDAWTIQGTCTATDTHPDGSSSAQLTVTIGGDLVSQGEILFPCLATGRTSSWAVHQGGTIRPFILAQFATYDIKFLAGN